MIAPNSLPIYEAHFGVPACGAILNTINIRLDIDTVAHIFDHGEAKALLVDSQFLADRSCAVRKSTEM